MKTALAFSLGTLFFLALPLAVRAQEDPPPKDKPLFPQLFPSPTGQNGYEELILAGDLLKNNAAFDAVVQGGATLTDRRRALTDRDVARALNLLRQGLAKPIHPPQETMDETRFEGLLHFRHLGRLLMTEQYVLLADGKVGSAIDNCRDGFKLAYEVQKEMLVGSLTGASINRVVTKYLLNHLDQLSVKDCERLIALVRDWLRTPDPTITAMQREREFALRNQQKFLPPGSEALGKQILVELDSRYDQYAAILKLPHWKRKEIPPAEGGAPIAEQLIKLLDPTIKQMYTSFAKDQAQMLILGTHAAIRRYRWEYERLPAGLEDLKLGELAIDPFTGKPLLYKRTGETTYELTSEGLKTPVIPP